MGPPAVSIPHATADPGTMSTILTSSAVTLSSTSGMSNTTSTSASASRPRETVSPGGDDVNGDGRRMPIYTDVRTTGTPYVDSYGAAPPQPAAVNKGTVRSGTTGRAGLIVGIGTALILFFGDLI